MPDWNLVRALAMPLAIALVASIVAWSLMHWLFRRVEGREQRHARIVRVLSLPLAFAIPLLFMYVAVGSLPLPAGAVGALRQVLHIGVVGCLTWLLMRVVAAGEQSILRRYPMQVADNLQARRIQTQTRVVARVLMGTVLLLGVSAVLLNFEPVKQLGRALLASAGIVGLVAGLAAKPVFGNLIAGLQIALTQPIRLDDVVIVEGEWGCIEEIGSAYVVVRIWDERRMVVPLGWFIENPFQNWTRSSANLLGTVFLWLDYRTPLAAVRAELERICRGEPLWDGRVCVTQVTETSEYAIQVRLLVSARSSGDAFDLRCIVRERMIDYLLREHSDALPRLRAELSRPAADAGPWPPARGSGGRSPVAEDGSAGSA